jgi:hypothetical protein
MHRMHYGGSLRALTSRGIFDAQDRCATIARSVAHTLHDQQSQDRVHENAFISAAVCGRSTLRARKKSIKCVL